MQEKPKRGLSGLDVLPKTTNDAGEQLPFSELTSAGKVKRIVIDYVLIIAIFVAFLYLFVCALSIMGSAFQLLGGKDAGRSLSNSELFDNPIAGLVLGVLATVLLQSSSTTSSIIITMTAANLLTVKQAIYMIMGANIGTSVTNTIVALGQIKDRHQFELAFAGATVHDMFNFLSVCVLLPIEAITGYLRTLTDALVASFDLATDKSQKKDLLKKITKPLTDRIVQIDKKPIEAIAKGEISVSEANLLKKICKKVPYISYDCPEPTVATNITLAANATSTVATTAITSTTATVTTASVVDFNITENMTVNATSCEKIRQIPCDYLFHGTSLSEAAVGAILLVCSLFVLCVALVFMVKILTRLLHGQVAKSIKTFVNAEFPGRAKYFTGYLAILIGAGLTILVQSSSVFTSAITPLVGMGIIDLERMYPLTLGANVGTTVTGVLAALASSNVVPAMQVAMAHLFFNLSGILVWYVIPVMRKPPIGAARFLGRTTSKYRWFAIAYVIVAFFLVPLAIFGLSLAGWKVLVGVGVPILCVALAILVLNILQKKRPNLLPEQLQTWEFLPFWMRSLQPIDKVFTAAMSALPCCKRNGDLEMGMASSDEDLTKTSPSASKDDESSVWNNTAV